MLPISEIHAMLYLLDDEDERVVQQIEDKLKTQGVEVVPVLEDYWQSDDSVARQEKIVSLIKAIKQDVLVHEMSEWLERSEDDLLGGMLIVNKIQFPSTDRQVIENQLDKIKLDAWLELNYDLTSFEKVRILNHIMFDVHGFEGDTDTYHHSKNSFISTVLQTKKGNPVTLAVIYAIIAQRLNIPVYGVNLPQHFILGYVQDLGWPPLLRFNDTSASENDPGGDIMFYINPFNKGLIFNKENIHKFLKQLKLEPKDNYFKTCSNKDILLRVLRNLEVSFAKEKKTEKSAIVQKLLQVMLRED